MEMEFFSRGVFDNERDTTVIVSLENLYFFAFFYPWEMPLFLYHVFLSLAKKSSEAIDGIIPKSVIKLLMVLKAFVESSNLSPPKTQPTHHHAAPRD